MRLLTHKEYIQKLKEMGSTVRPIESYRGMAIKIKHSNVCGHVWYARPNIFLVQKSGCPRCFFERHNKTKKWTKEYFEKYINALFPRYELVEPFKGWFKSIEVVDLRCGNSWIAYPENLIRGTGCPCNSRRVSRVALDWLKEESFERGIDIKTFANGEEYRIPGTRYRVDGFHKESKTIFEFYGDYWHGNPRHFSDKQSQSRYCKTRMRERKLKSLGYKLVTKWESDFNVSQ